MFNYVSSYYLEWKGKKKKKKMIGVQFYATRLVSSQSQNTFTHAKSVDFPKSSEYVIISK